MKLAFLGDPTFGESLGKRFQYPVIDPYSLIRTAPSFVCYLNAHPGPLPDGIVYRLVYSVTRPLTSFIVLNFPSTHGHIKHLNTTIMQTIHLDAIIYASHCTLPAHQLDIPFIAYNTIDSTVNTLKRFARGHTPQKQDCPQPHESLPQYPE